MRAEAQQLFARALQLRQLLLVGSGRHQQDADELCELALLLKEEGNHAEAAILIERACSVAKSAQQSFM